MTSSELQQQSKAKALAHLLTRENGFAVNVDDVIAGQPWGYRRRARLSLNYQPKTQTLQIGFREKPPASWSISRNAPFWDPNIMC